MSTSRRVRCGWCWRLGFCWELGTAKHSAGRRAVHAPVSWPPPGQHWYSSSLEYCNRDPFRAAPPLPGPGAPELLPCLIHSYSRPSRLSAAGRQGRRVCPTTSLRGRSRAVGRCCGRGWSRGSAPCSLAAPVAHCPLAPLIQTRNARCSRVTRHRNSAHTACTAAHAPDRKTRLPAWRPAQQAAAECWGQPREPRPPDRASAMPPVSTGPPPCRLALLPPPHRPPLTCSRPHRRPSHHQPVNHDGSRLAWRGIAAAAADPFAFCELCGEACARPLRARLSCPRRSWRGKPAGLTCAALRCRHWGRHRALPGVQRPGQSADQGGWCRREAGGTQGASQG